MKTVWMAGASGLVGSHVLPRLLDDPMFATVVSLGRRALDVVHPKLVQRTVDFASLDTGGLASPDVAICTLGTTLGKAGSKEAFRAVDHGAVLAFAKASLAAAARSFVVVSSLGANSGSRVFYNRGKGATEADRCGLGFASLAIAQPSLLLGDRVESRPAERVLVVASRFLAGVLEPFAARPIEADVVARALVALAREPPAGVVVYPSSRLQALGGEAPAR